MACTALAAGPPWTAGRPVTPGPPIRSSESNFGSHGQTVRCISSAVGTRPSGINPSTTCGRRSLRPARSSARQADALGQESDLLLTQYLG
jgi:hypothetical protein